MKADLSKLFVLDEAFEKGAARAGFATSGTDLDNWVIGKCTNIIALRQNTGRSFYDLLGTTHAGSYLLSQRIQDVLSMQAITGWRACPVELTTSKGEAPPQYAAIGITGRCGPIQKGRSKKVTRLVPGTDLSTESWIGLYFDEDTWDGCDLFRPNGTMLTVVTSRAKEAIDSAAATNIRFRPLLEIERTVL